MPVSRFVYKPAPGWGSASAAEALAPEPSALGDAAEDNSESVPGNAGTTRSSAPDAKQSWQQGYNEAEANARSEYELAINRHRDLINHALRDFLNEREAYFHRVEGEVVALALAIVRKILRREAQLDALLLSGLVRVALEKMAVTQNVRLRVHPSQIAAWQDYLAHHNDLPVMPELLGDTALEPDQCRLETELGVMELSLEMQLKEIEQGLFDLLAQRPSAR